jgi:carboxymethylenebutenolidase
LIDIAVPTGSADALLVAPASGATGPGVLLMMDAFGLRPELEAKAERLAEAGYVVLVPNVFHRSGRAPLVALDRLADPEQRVDVLAELGELMAALTPAQVAADAHAWLRVLAENDQVLPGPVGVVGYCLGGALAVRVAAELPDRVAVVASFHAGGLATDDPESPHLLLDRVTAEVYVAHADQDPSMPPEQQQRLGEALVSAGVGHLTELYDGAGHGFTMRDRPAYDEAATTLHWHRLLPLLRRCLG